MGQISIFFKNLALCHEFHNLVTRAGRRIELVTGSSDREAQLERFENGETEGLVNCMVLTEGFDCPDLATVWVRDSQKGPTIQMGGRVFRNHESLPYKQIVQSVGTKHPFMRTALPDLQFIWRQNEWRSLTVNPKLLEINAAARWAIAHAPSDFPQWLNQRNKKRRFTPE